MTTAYVCPRCKTPLLASAGKCTSCAFPIEVRSNGSPLLNNESFEDWDHSLALQAYETGKLGYYAKDVLINRQFILNFTLPLLKRLFGERKDIRILSVGCGIGIDVDILREHGYEAWGTDCGSRCMDWSYRKHPEFLAQCTDASMPFQDGFFDFVMCHQVLEHVGVVGDSLIMRKDWKSVRQTFLNNLMRLVKPSGYANVATPNRTFPLDPGHSPNFFGLRVHGPLDRFLTSYGDMRGYFAGHDVRPVTPANYYAGTFASRVGRVGTWFSRYIGFLDRRPSLQGTFMNPLTNVLVRKAAQPT